jgi:hypothetical protein
MDFRRETTESAGARGEMVERDEEAMEEEEVVVVAR